MEKGLKIVLVDDNTDYLFTMETFLSRNGFEVKTSDDAEKGLAVIRSERPDLVLLDVMMETLFSGFLLFFDVFPLFVIFLSSFYLFIRSGTAGRFRWCRP